MRTLRKATDPLAPSSAHDALARSLPLLQDAPPAVRCASLSTCCPARRNSLGTAAAALPLHPFHPAARSTSGVAPLRSPQSLPYVRPPVKGSTWCHCVLHSLGRDASKNYLRSPARRSKRHPPTLRELHQCTASSLLCQVGCPGSLIASRLASRRWVRASKTTIVRRQRSYVKLRVLPTPAT